ncbi:MAG: transcription termination factor NusA [bacterium]|nr:transcription termination factor NusA [bacterium]
MIDLKNLNLLMAHLAEEKGLSQEQVMEALETSLAAAYKKEYGKRGQHVLASLDIKTGDMIFLQSLLVVDESMIYSEEELEQLKDKPFDESHHREESGEENRKVRFSPDRHIMLKEAKALDKKVIPGQELQLPLETHTDFGRIAAQTAKQVILQKVREAEREMILKEYKGKEYQIVSGSVQRVEGRVIFIDLGKTLGILPREEQIPGEFYRPGQRLRFYVESVQDTPRGPTIRLSRAHPLFVSKLFELEVPEISGGALEIKSIVREPGSRTKVSVSSLNQEVDPIGAMVGQRGTRVSAVINELGGEKIDIIQWAEDVETYIANSLSPAKVLQVELHEQNRSVAIVSEDQLSLAIGREGQNVRLAARLTGWKVDIRTTGGKEVAMEEHEAPEERDNDGDGDNDKDNDNDRNNISVSSPT